MAFDPIRVLIWGKTYPELSSRYVETVCTGALREDGTPVRLYPVPLRYLATGKQYALYDWIEVPAQKSTSDPRPESLKVVSEKIDCVGHIGTENGTWRSRQQIVFRNPSWHFASMAALKAAEAATKRSMGLVTPGDIVDVRLARKPDGAARKYSARMTEIQSQRDVFRPEYKELEYLPFDVKLTWHCLGPCAGCARKPHDMKVLDWGLLELGRRQGWEKARDKLSEISNLDTHDFRLFMGNFRLHPKNFGVIGLWYPKKRPQLELL